MRPGEKWVRVRKLRDTRRYRKLRSAFLAAHPWCASCEDAGLSKPAEEIDHIRPAIDIPLSAFYDTGNWQGLCRPCHWDKTLTEKGERRTAQATPEHREWDLLMATGG